MAEVLLIAGTVASAVGGLADGYAAARQYEGQAQVADYNAKVSTENAYRQLAHASSEELAHRRQTRLALGEAAAASASSGVALEGAPMDSLAQSAANAEFDALNIRYRGQLAARGDLSQAELDRIERDQAKANAKSAKTRAWITAGTRALTGAGNYMDKFGGSA